MYLALWLIRRWRLPATPILILPVAVSLKRFLTPLLVFSLGIFVSLCALRFRVGRRLSNRHGMPFGRAIGFPTIWKACAPTDKALKRQAQPAETERVPARHGASNSVDGADPSSHARQCDGRRIAI